MLLDLVDPISQFTQPCIAKSEMEGPRNCVLGTHPIRAVAADEVDIDLEVVQETVSVYGLAAHEQRGRLDAIGILWTRGSEVAQRCGELEPHLR